MITTLALELVSLLLSFNGVDAEATRRIVSSSQHYPLGNPVGRGQPGSPRAALLTENDNPMTLHFTYDLTPTLFVVGGPSNIALADPDAESDVVRLDRNDYVDRPPRPDWTPTALPVGIAEGWQS